MYKDRRLIKIKKKLLFFIILLFLSTFCIYDVDAKAATKLQIDSPEQPEEKKKNMLIRGWVMSEAEERTIEVYVDGKKQGEVKEQTREDVLKAINGYGGRQKNPIPGFIMYYDSTKLTAGNHQVTVKVVDNNTQEVLTEYTKNFVVKPYTSYIEIDSPTSYATGDTLLVRGWVMSEAEDKYVEVYIDDQKIENIQAETREDVLKAINGYGGRQKNPTPGFRVQYNILSIKDGYHKVKIVLKDSNTDEVINTVSKTFFLKKYNGQLNVENPVTSNLKGSVIIRGWEMSESDNSIIKIYVDNKEITETIERVPRQDVVDAIKNYGDIQVNSTPGFQTIINLPDGKHRLNIKLITKYGDEITEFWKDIYVYSKVSFGIDVSKYQHSIDWSAVKNDGISFAFVRAAYRGYGTGEIVEDPYFKSNVENASNVGIKVGLYFFSQAVNEWEAQEEAEFVINQIKNNGYNGKINLPIVIDTEYSSGAPYGRADGLSKEERTKIVRTFCNTIRNYGFEAMVYASKNFLYHNLDMNQLSDIDVWLAHYTTTVDPMAYPSDYTGIYKVWQYTSQGTVSGIIGKVDLNVGYDNY